MQSMLYFYMYVCVSENWLLVKHFMQLTRRRPFAAHTFPLAFRATDAAYCSDYCAFLQSAIPLWKITICAQRQKHIRPDGFMPAYDSMVADTVSDIAATKHFLLLAHKWGCVCDVWHAPLMPHMPLKPNNKLKRRPNLCTLVIAPLVLYTLLLLNLLNLPNFINTSSQSWANFNLQAYWHPHLHPRLIHTHTIKFLASLFWPAGLYR